MDYQTHIVETAGPQPYFARSPISLSQLRARRLELLRKRNFTVIKRILDEQRRPPSPPSGPTHPEIHRRTRQAPGGDESLSPLR